jgi:hypothetical protein
MASLILSTLTNPGAATWSSAAGSLLQYPVAGFAGIGGTATPTENASYWCSTSGSQVDITVVAPTFCGQIITFFFQSDAGQNVVMTFPAALNSDGNTIVTMNDAEDSFAAMAVYTGTNLRWVPMFNNGCVLS